MATHWHKLHGSAFRGRSALVTGGAGFIGSHLSAALIELGANVTVLDDLSNGAPGNVPAKARFIRSSILERDRLDEAMAGVELVFHEAALGSVPRSVELPEQYIDVNIRGTYEVLRASSKAGVKRVVFAASSSAYGDTVESPKHEQMPPLPRSPYAATKVADEALMRSWSHSFGLDTVCLRYFNIFGPRQNANSAYAAVIAAFAAALFAGKRPVIFGDGLQTRDFTHVDNAVHANLLAARSLEFHRGEVANVACGGAVSVTELAETMAKLAGRPDLTPLMTQTRTGDVLHSRASIVKARELWGYIPIVPLEVGLADTIEWYRTQLSPAAASHIETRQNPSIAEQPLAELSVSSAGGST